MLQIKDKVIQKRHIILYSLLSFLCYSLITSIIFQHRIQNITTQYAMPDVDTDGGLWYQWFINYIHRNKLPYDVINIIGYPFGYDISLSPAVNLIYSIQLFILEYILGFSWSNLILVTNISSLITYPLSGLGAFILSYYITRNKYASFICGLIFAFSFYHVYMGRGEMSINHIELIPVYILSLLLYLNKKKLSYLVFSSLIFSLLFYSDAYYAFFSGLFSLVIFILYKHERILTKIKNLLLYYVILFAMLILTNFNFVLANLYLFDAKTLALTGRISDPRNELVNILYYFIPIQVNYLYTYYPLLGFALYPVTLGIGLMGLIVNNKNKIYLTFAVCFLLAIVLSVYISPLYWINELYFKYFKMFRSVGRMPLPAYLFLGLMVSMSIDTFMKSSIYKRSNRFITVGLFVILSLIVIVTSLVADETWSRSTNFKKIADLYSPLAENKSIHVIAAYPIQLNFVSVGFPQTYQLMGQIIHNKAYANGADLSSVIGRDYQKNIKDISRKDTIDYLAQYGVDTILIYNNLLDKASLINDQLRIDSRLKFLGNYKQPFDKGYVSANDKSRNISVYQIKTFTNISQSPLFSTSKNEKVSYKQIDSYRYVIMIKNVVKNTRLSFNFPYTSKWVLFNGDLSQINDLVFMSPFVKSLSTHTSYKQYANSWSIDVATLDLSNPHYFKKNQDGSYDIEYTLYFKPQSMVYLGQIISTFTIITSIIIILFYNYRISKTKKQINL